MQEVERAIKTGEDVVAGLDVGSASIKIVVTRAPRPGLITGAGISPSAGILKGEVYDAPAAARSVSEALSQAATTSRVKIKNVCLGIPGDNLKTFPAQARVVFRKNRPIQRKDIDALLKMAGQLQLPAGRKLIQIVPQEFCVGRLVTARAPVGVVGGDLGCKAKAITVEQELINKITSLFNLLRIKVMRVGVNILAAARVTLGEVEKQLGVVLVDLGSSATGLAIFKNGVLLEADVLPVGSAHITSDLAIGLGTSLSSAESLKRRIGLNGDRKYKEVFHIIRARLEEMFALLKEKIARQNILPCGIVLTGGGALLKGLPEAAAEYFGVCVRVGAPQVSKFPAGFNPGPAWCVSVGLTAGGKNDQ